MKCPNCMTELRLVAGSGEAVDATEVGGLLDQIDMDTLDDEWDMKFVSETRTRWAQYGDRIRMSPKQMSALRKIAAK